MADLELEEENVHQRVLKLRDAALGSRQNITVNSSLAHASYECVVDSLLALYSECSREQAGLAHDKHVARFLNKYEAAVEDLNLLRLTPEDFSVKAVIGRGHFGEVQVVHEKSTGDVHAMKVMKKSHILQQADAAFFLEERDIMAWTNSQWLTSLHYAFQDSSHLYLVMDFHPGGDLLSAMERNEGGMSESDARFYLTEIAMGLHDLHTLGFVHRDVKPENVLITRSGHIKLVDFGSAARLGPGGKVLEARLPVGTPEYIAPEVLTSLDRTADYGVCCDWWSLGIIAYELVYDVTPFTGGSTSETYGNIMNYEKSLSFPDGVEVSDDLRNLVSHLLTSPGSRLTFPGLQTHSFFSSLDWTRLLQMMPPYIPSVTGPDDTSNFDEFETQRDCGEDHLTTPQPRRTLKGFSGKSLPFIGFTFTKMDSVNLMDDAEKVRESGERKGEGHGEESAGEGRDEEDGELKRQLELAGSELKELRERKSSLERECVIYQSQLEDFHRKLEIEKVEHRHSDGQALQLLEEVREQGKIAQQLRESEARSTCEQLNKVIEQLEQERGVASKRARRLQDELQRVQQERDSALKRISDYKAKVSEVKQSGRKDISALQTKLAKVTKDSLGKVAEMQDRLTEAHSRFSESSKRVQQVESERRKLEYSLQQAKMGDSLSSSEAARNMTKKLEEAESARTKVERDVVDLKHQLEVRDQENSGLHSQCQQFSQQIKVLEDQWQSANSRQEQLEAAEWDLKTRLGQAYREKEKAVTTNKQMEKTLKELEKAVGRLNSEKQALENELKSKTISPKSENRSSAVQQGGNGEGIKRQLAEREREVKGLQVQLDTAKKEGQQLRESLRSVQVQLSETSNLYIAQGDKLREVRRSRMELDQENTTLKTTLNRTKSEVVQWRRKFEEVSEELTSLGEVRKTVKGLQKEVESLISQNKDAKRDVEVSRAQRQEAVVARNELEATLRNAKKEIEAQELSVTMFQKKLSSVEEELCEVRGTVEENRGREGEWRECREHLQTDLEAAEKRVEDAHTEVEKEKGLRALMEQNLTDTMSSLEKTAAAHSEEQQRLASQLATQKQLASKYSDRVSQLEKEGRLRGLELREVQKELETEKSLSSKLYDDLHSLGREHGRLKAAHIKMLQESRQKAGQLSQEASARERAVEEQKVAAQSHMVQETKLQATIAQQNKLIDFLQKPSSPSRGSRLTLKGLRFTRKSRDPAKEIAEWKKIKGLAAKPKHRGVIADTCSRSVSLQREASSLPVLRSSSSQLSLTSTASCSASPQLSTPADTNVVHLPPTYHIHDDTISMTGSEVTTTNTTTTCTSQKSESGGYVEATPTTSSARVSSASVPAVKRLSVDIHRQQTTQDTPRNVQMRDVTPKKSKKRGLEMPSGTSSSARPSSKLGIEHNIPHKFVLKSAPLHKSYTCSFCKSTIKTMHKFVKCSYCGHACHTKCSNQLPNNCGLPAELVDFDLSQPSSAKKQKTEEEEDKDKGEREEEREEPEANQGREDIIKTPESVVRRLEETKKIGRVYVPKGEVKSECWLVLTNSSLLCYDRHPAGVTRKPINSFCWTDPNSLVVVLSKVDSRAVSYQNKLQPLLFAVEQHSMAGVKRAVFIAATLEEKQEWMSALESAITRNSVDLVTSTSSNSTSRGARSRPGSTVTPVRTSRRLATRPPSTPCITSSSDSSEV